MIHSLPSPLFSQVFLDVSLEYRFLIESYLSDSPVKVNHSVVTVCNFIILAFLVLRLVQMWNFQIKKMDDQNFLKPNAKYLSAALSYPALAFKVSWRLPQKPDIFSSGRSQFCAKTQFNKRRNNFILFSLPNF